MAKGEVQKVNIVISAYNKTKRAFKAVTAGLGSIRKMAAFALKMGIAPLVGIAGFGYLIKRSMNLTDELAKSSRAIGVSVEALQRLRHAANLGGIESKALDKAVQKLAINIADVASGTGEAKDAFEKYAISAVNGDGTLRSVGSVMGQVADVMQGMTNQTERASLAYELFGARGAKMVNVLKDGKAGLHAAMLEADKLGLVMDSNTVKGVEAANDAITRFTSYLGGVFHRTVAEIAPIIKTVTDNLREWVELKMDSSGGAGGFAKEMAKQFVAFGKTAVAVFTSITNTFIRLTNSMGGIANMYEKAFGNKRMTEEVQAEIRTTTGLIETLTARKSKWYAMGVQDADKQIAQYKLQKAALTELITTGQTFSALGNTSAIDSSGALASLDQMLVKLNEAKAAGSSGTKPKDDYGAILQLQNDHYMVLQDAKKTHEEKMLALSQLYIWKESAIQQASSKVGVKDVKEGGKEALAALAQHYKGAFKLHKTFALSQAIIDTYKAVSTALSSAPPPLNYGMAAVALAKGMAQVQTIRATQFRQFGGPVVAGQPYTVGERGRELFVPSTGGKIVSNDELQGNAPTVNNIYITNHLIDGAGVNQLFNDNKAALANTINGMVIDQGREALI